MSITLSKSRGDVYQFRKAPLKYEQTFKTPLKELPRFVATILSPFPATEARVTIDQIVFEPKNLLELLATSGIDTHDLRSTSITATGHEDVPVLLEASFADWVDFLFVPSPDRFVLYADHDEWTTVFAANEVDLASMKSALHGGGFEMITGYTRF
ncbi:MAG TPA: hypothetical protein VE218_08500 [Acidobacteriaceae bacterium]|nr:hypothetical protein [Acidobacteriaceae bacterium]